MNHALFKFLDVNRLNMFAINNFRNIRALLSIRARHKSQLNDPNVRSRGGGGGCNAIYGLYRYVPL